MKTTRKEIEWDNLNQSKWMRYEDDIIKYYYKQLKKWLDEGMEKPAIIQFTSGLGRNIALLMEDSKIQGQKQLIDEEIKFLEALKKWRSWDRMSEFAQANVNNRLEGLKQKIEK